MIAFQVTPRESNPNQKLGTPIAKLSLGLLHDFL